MKRDYLYLHLLLCLLAVAGCDTQEMTAAPDPQAAQASEVTAEGTHVSASLRLSQTEVRRGEQVELSVELSVAPMWEIHTLDAQPAVSATRLDVTTPPGMKMTGEWSEPTTSRSMGPSGQGVYIGRVVFTRKLEVDSQAAIGGHEVSCSVGYQVCNDRQCLKPEVLSLAVPLAVR